MLPQAGGEYVYLRQSYGPAGGVSLRLDSASSSPDPDRSRSPASALRRFFQPSCQWARPGPRRPTTRWACTMHWQFGLTQVVAIAAILFFAVVNCLTAVVGVAAFTPRSRSSRLPASRSSWSSASPCLSTTAHWSDLASPSTAPSGGAAAFSAWRCWRPCGRTTAGTICRWRPERCRIPAATCRERSSAALLPPSWRSTAPPTSPTSTRCRGPMCSARIRRRTATRCRSPRKPRKRRSARAAASSCRSPLYCRRSAP